MDDRSSDIIRLKHEAVDNAWQRWGGIVAIAGAVLIFVGVLAPGPAGALCAQFGGALLATGGIIIVYESAISRKYIDLIREITDLNRVVQESGLRRVDLEDTPAHLRQLFQDAAKLDITGTTCYPMLSKEPTIQVLATAIRNGCRLRIVVLHPDCDALDLSQKQEGRAGGAHAGRRSESRLGHSGITMG